MKLKALVFILLVFNISVVCSQDKNDNKGVSDVVNYVVYKMAEMQQVNVNNSPKNLQYEEMISAFDKIECGLYYTKSKSVFKMIDKLELNNDISYQLAAVFAEGQYYKDIIAGTKIKHTEEFGEILNIIMPFEQYKWQISTETKTISGYKCYKANCQWEEFDVIRNKKLVFNSTVWFAPEIAAPFGPLGLDGLPGLVLEGSLNGISYFYATSVTFDIKKANINLNKPVQGKFVTEKEYADFTIKSFENFK
ncbi:GLPGLI family protein [Flavobacterium sp. K5-23]|uniref:GLPGLI family protein n=1 Tax=Flavobacterium sp. K5-23 TaxID=2746225 RepID=UPI00200FF6EB|nr:GLPGLI family protein [Flavobacterium sp. K5-23]UQD55253.1 GLPGLI family protein [Flavobacterium sp. K5-23]